MKLIFSTTDLWTAFNTLTSATRGYVLPQTRSAEPSAALHREGSFSPAVSLEGHPLEMARLELVETAVGLPPLMGAAVRFTIQLAIEVAKIDSALARLVRALAGAAHKLATWGGEEGAMALRLWTHDGNCVLGDLERAARRYALPQQPSSDAAAMLVVQTLLRNLTVAAVAFTVQLAIEETALDVSELRSLEGALISELDAPWELDNATLSVDVQDGQSWGSRHELSKGGE